MNSPMLPREIPACIAKHEPDAIYGWFSSRCLLIVKDGETVTLSADDLRNLVRFIDGCVIEEQLS